MDQTGVSPITVTRHPHHLPSWTVEREFNATGKTAAWVVADCHGLPEGRQLLRAEELLCRQGLFFFLLVHCRLLGRKRRGRCGRRSLRNGGVPGDSKRPGCNGQRQHEWGYESSEHCVSNPAGSSSPNNMYISTPEAKRRLWFGFRAPRYTSTFSAAINASCGISTLPNCRMRFFPSFCFSRSFRFRVASPP